ncbi:ribose transport system permease protein [Vreelandella subterranea]|uniref:Ribose transport system permease protein n=1 Tax=Vreelandella subterranea TaxID=416874 RepID=A0A1H9RN06_9GAMM|nr:ABC transporter permease [Halomonas subterranea]SER74291.1 ribose transport system permease protein [Halomonas subterranea]
MTIKKMADSGLMIMVIYLIIFAIYAAVQPSALSAYSIQGLFNNSLPLMLAAAGATFVILQGGFDLSVAGTISLVNSIVAVLQFDGAIGAVGILGIALTVGILVGAINGFVVAYLKIQAIAATLATMIICQGIALLILRAPGGYVSDFMAYELTGSVLEVPVSIIVAFLVAMLWFVFRRTNAGRNLLAIGQDAKASELSGIDVARTKFFSFIWAGAFYALAAYFLAAQTSTGSPSAGEPFLLLTFAAVALGGTAFGGGRGGVTASLLGAATLVLMQKFLFSIGVSSFYTGMVQGLIMILAVLFSGAVQFVVDKRNIT